MKADKKLPYKVKVAKISVDPIPALLLFPVFITLAIAALAVIMDPETFNTYWRQMGCMFGVGFLWLLWQFARGKDD